ncbi:MAG TPA: hypothetical protein PLJ12_04315 [Planctomycetota bacterium]|nr:hypothetical protein [Planctomycetota bacterium]
MTSTRHTFHWRPGDPGGDMQLSLPLSQRWKELEEDRTSTAEEIVREASQILRDWLVAVPTTDSHRLGALLGAELDPLLVTHGWRGPVALWWHTIDRAVGQAPASRIPLREVLIEEMGLWLGGLDVDREAGTEPRWIGEPLAAGLRLPRRDRCVEPLLPEVQVGETLLIPAFSETVAQAIERLVAGSLRPSLILGEGGPSLGGRQMARRLEHTGCEMRLVYDAALPRHVAAVDRMWLGTEALGAGAMVAVQGVSNLIQEARRQQVPVAILATSDKLMPHAELKLPRWAETETYLLWDSPTDGLTVESQFFERVPLEAHQPIATEMGLRTPAQLALQALRTEDLA